MELWSDGLSTRQVSSRCGRKMVRIGMIGMVLGLLVVPAWAEAGEGKHRHDPKSKLEKMTKRYSLTEEQRATILPILEEKHQKMQALHEQMKATRQQATEKIEAVLTPEQQEKYKKRREARMNKMKEYREKRKKGHKKDHKKNRKRDHGKDHTKDRHDQDDDEHEDENEDRD